MEKVNKKDYDILQTAYEQLVHQYTAVVNQNKSLQQYPKLFNEQIFKGFTPEEVIEAAKVQILQKAEMSCTTTPAPQKRRQTMKKYDLKLTVFAEKEYKGIEALNRDDAEAMAIQMFKANDYPHIIIDDCSAEFLKEYD